MLRQEAIRRGMGQAGKVVLLIDGAPGLENMGHLNFRDATQVVDFYHAAEHAGKVVEALLGSKEHPEYKARRSRWVRRLLGNGVENLIKETRQECAGRAQAQAVAPSVARLFRLVFSSSFIILAMDRTILRTRTRTMNDRARLIFKQPIRTASAAMHFTVPWLKQLAAVTGSLTAKQTAALSSLLHRRQPAFCEIIDDVGLDPRCAQAHRFCTTFCALALQQAEAVAGWRLPKFRQAAIKEVQCCVAQGREAAIGKRACRCPKRLRRHVIGGRGFDADDTAWLGMAISAFLFLTRRSISRAP